MKKFAVFADRLVTTKVFHEYLLSSVPKIESVADSRKSFSGNEEKYIKPQNLFTAKQKQYTVLTSGINRYPAMAWAWIDSHSQISINWHDVTCKASNQSRRTYSETSK